eukprot:15340307-Ditylum_brightwellii.AAC.2
MGWDISYNFLPHGNKVVKSLNRTQLAAVKKGEEEALYDRPPHQQKIVDGDVNIDYSNGEVKGK